MTTRFDLDRAVARHLRGLAVKRLVSRMHRDEIEAHLRDEIEDRIRAGDSAEAAFRAATKSLGTSGELLGEYAKLFGASRRAQLANLLTHYCDTRIIMRIAFGLGFGAFFMLLGLMLEGGSLGHLVCFTSFLIVVGGAVGALIIAYPVSTVTTSVVLAATGREAARGAYSDAARVFQSFGDLALLASFVGLIFGAIHVLQNLQHPQSIGPGVAVAVTAILYGLLVKLFVAKPLYDAFTTRAAGEARRVSDSAADGGDEGAVA